MENSNVSSVLAELDEAWGASTDRNKNKRKIITSMPELDDKRIVSLGDLMRNFGYCPSTDTEYVNDWYNTGWIGKYNLDLVLSYALTKNASDVHIACGRDTSFTILGDIYKQDEFVIPDDDIGYDLTRQILSHEAMSYFAKDFEYDFSYKIRFGPYKGRRFRVNLGKSFDQYIYTFRAISDEIPTMASLGIDNTIYDMFTSSTGVVLVCGSTGSGKSTTLASIMRDIQLNERKKIITVERPIEYVYPNDGKGIIWQREVPTDCLSFENGLTSSMRSAIDIILIGEVRNRTEVDELLRASETGHLAVSTIHTANNVTTLNRIRSLYAGDEQRRVLSTLGDNLRGVINQVLVKTKDGKSRYAVREILDVDFKIRRLIQEDKLSKIREIQEANHSTLEHLLLKEYKDGKITLSEAESKSPDRTYFRYLLNNN